MQPHRLLEPAQRRLTSIREREQLADAELSYHIRDQDPARVGVSADAGRQLDGSTEQVTVLLHWFASA